MMLAQPVVFEPFLRPMVWGGRKLAELFGKPLNAHGLYGESWEVSAHPHGVTRVAEGPLGGVSLPELCAQHPRELFGATAPDQEGFPLLIKLLDARERLSVQVHPNDEQALRLAGELRGKTEVWVVLDVEPEGWVLAGLKPGVSRGDLLAHLDAGTVAECLHQFTPHPGDVLFLPAGTVHSVGGGVVLAEVQQSSDATFRLFDWNRPGMDGLPRPLHIRESLESINWGAGPVSPVRPRPLAHLPAGVRGEELVRCRYFHLDRYQVQTAMPMEPSGRLSVWMVVEGAADLHAGLGYARAFRKGETVLIPAACPALRWVPREGPEPVLLCVSLP